MPPSISVLIPTLGRSRELVDTVRALGAQTVVPDEIIVVDQNQPALSEVDEFLASVPNVRHLRSTLKGVVANVNFAIREARCEVCLFLDDDVDMSPKLVEMHRAAYVTGGLVLGGVAGRVEQPSGDLPENRLARVGQFRRWLGIVVANFNSRLPREVSLAQGAHMSFKKSALERIGGVDEKFDGNGYFWESDLSLRIVKAGYRILFEPRAELRHLMAPAGGCRVTDKSLHTYYFIKNGVRLCRRHSPWLARFVYLPRMIGYVVAKAVYNRDLAILRRGLLGVWDGVRL